MISLNASSAKPKKPGQKEEPKQVKKTEKELDEFRKAGAPPQVFSDDGKELNPYIPHFISTVPWFYKSNEPTLRHQSDGFLLRPSLSDIKESYIKGAPIGEAPIKFKPGACENCGSVSHKKKDCLERPRKIGAKFTNKDMKPADYVQPVLTLDFEGKRDRWAGYNSEEYAKVVDEYEIIEKTKQDLKSKKLEDDILQGTSSTTILKTTGIGNDQDSEDEEKYADSSSMPGTKYDSKQRTTVRNLRIREDTAKYLYNLDENSAFYDPKSRSMRENPLQDTIKGQNIHFKGDSVGRKNGEVLFVDDATSFTLSAYEKGIDVHILADPTKSELLMKQFNTRKEALYTDQKKNLISRYGGGEYLFAPPKEMLLEQREDYVEYSRTGKLIKGQERAPIRSKYVEDVYIKNHTSVWGSYWHDFEWGYSCCHSLLKNSYCIELLPENKSSIKDNTFEEDEKRDIEDGNIEHNFVSTKRPNIEDPPQSHSCKKKNNSKYHVIHETPLPTEQEMEKYRVTKKRQGDPMMDMDNTNNS